MKFEIREIRKDGIEVAWRERVRKKPRDSP